MAERRKQRITWGQVRNFPVLMSHTDTVNIPNQQGTPLEILRTQWRCQDEEELSQTLTLVCTNDWHNRSFEKEPGIPTWVTKTASWHRQEFMGLMVTSEEESCHSQLQWRIYPNKSYYINMGMYELSEIKVHGGAKWQKRVLKGIEEFENDFLGRYKKLNSILETI